MSVYRLQFFFRSYYIEEYTDRDTDGDDAAQQIIQLHLGAPDLVWFKVMVVTFGGIPNYGNVYTMDQFKSMVEAGRFIDRDGHGNLASEDECSNVQIRPFEVYHRAIPDWATHVVWYNR